MPEFQKAYRLSALRRYEAWPPELGASLGENAIVFVRQDLSVGTSSVDRDAVLFRDDGAGWARFCREQLAFAVPDWEQESEGVRLALREG